jgi:hypothetical protein
MIFFDLTGVYFNSTSQTNSNINIDELDIRYLQTKKVEQYVIIFQ